MTARFISRSMDCEHEKLRTPFCPQCGERIQASDIQSLLAYLRNQAAAKLRDYEKAQDGETDTWQKGRKRSADKWARWVAALEKLISAGEGGAA